MMKKHVLGVMWVIAALGYGQWGVCDIAMNDMRLGLHADKTRLVMDLDDRVSYQTFYLKQPNRFVISVRGIAASQAIDTNIKRMLFRQHKILNMSRIEESNITNWVFTLPEHVTVEHFTLSAPYRIVADFR